MCGWVFIRLCCELNVRVRVCWLFVYVCACVFVLVLGRLFV